MSAPADAAATSRSRRKLRRRLSGTLVLALGLAAAGFGITAVNDRLSPAQADQTASTEELVREGKSLYDTSCISCHGANLQGVENRGPSLVGIGEGAVYFQVMSGRMPMTRNEAQVTRKPPKFSEQQTLAIAAYVNQFGGGPGLVRDDNGDIAQSSLRGKNYDAANGAINPADVARGSELFRLNCASCHNFTGRGGALSSGKFAPIIDPASEQEIYQAMRGGPQNMPRFSDRQLSPEEKKDIIAFLKNNNAQLTPGGYTLGGFGPGTEGLFIWTVGIVALVGATLWIGARS